MEDTKVSTKKCLNCRTEYPETAQYFKPRLRKAGGFYDTCKKCEKPQSNKRLVSNPAKRRGQCKGDGRVIYFVQPVGGGNIKIGYTSNVSRRIHELQKASPVELALLGTIQGSLTYEARLHDQFAHLRLWGEWFSPSEELLEFICKAMVHETSNIPLENVR